MPDPEPPTSGEDEVNAGDYDTISEAIANVPAGGTLFIPAGTAAIEDTVTFNNDITVKGNGVAFEKSVVVSDAAVTFDNIKLVATGANVNDKTPAIKVNGTKPFTLKNSEISGTTRTALSIMTSGKIVFENNVFDAGDKNIYNMVEFSISNARDIADVTFKNNTFKGPCLSFSLEMSNKQVLQRFYSYMTGVAVSDIARGKLIESANPNQWDDLLRENEALFGHSDDKAPKLLLNDESAISLSNIERDMAQCQLNYGAVGAVFIDYLQLMDIDIKNNGTKANALGEVTKALKNLAKKYNTVIFILCQLNRAANNDSLKPSDIKDSGSIEQDCDVIFMIGRKFKKLNYLDPSQQADDALLFVAKNRNGPVGKLEMTYNGRAMKFEENNLGNSYNNAGVTSDYS